MTNEKSHIDDDTNNHTHKEKLDHVRVGEFSREVARKPIYKQVDDLRSEFDTLNRDKRIVEREIDELNAWKRGELAIIYSSSVPKSLACARTNALENEFITKRNELRKRLFAIEERRHAIKTRLSDKGATDYRREVNYGDALREITGLLQRIANKLGA